LRFSNCEIIEIGEVLMNKNEHETLIGIAGEKTKTLKSVEDVAKFICEEGKRGDVQITREDGTPFLDTFGIYINRIADMEYRTRLLEVLIPMQKRLDGTPMTVKEQYPTGTRIELIKMGEDPQPVPPGTRGTVDYVDDADQIHMKWDNGRTLALVISEDEFRTLDQDEINEERCKKFIEGVNKNVLSSFDMGKMIEAYTDKDMSYPTEILKGMHNEFLKVYGTDEVNRDMGFVTVPAVVKVRVSCSFLFIKTSPISIISQFENLNSPLNPIFRFENSLAFSNISLLVLGGISCIHRYHLPSLYFGVSFNTAYSSGLNLGYSFTAPPVAIYGFPSFITVYSIYLFILGMDSQNQHSVSPKSFIFPSSSILSTFSFLVRWYTTSGILALTYIAEHLLYQ
jgi:hypothetical protein